MEVDWRRTEKAEKQHTKTGCNMEHQGKLTHLKHKDLQASKMKFLREEGLVSSDQRAKLKTDMAVIYAQRRGHPHLLIVSIFICSIFVSFW